MSDRYPETHPKGDYRLKVVGHAIASPKEAGKKPYLKVKVEVLGPSKQGAVMPGVKWGANRFVNFFFTSDKMIEKSKGWLKAAGFSGALAQLNPDHPNPISLAGFEFNGSNEPERSTSKDPKYAGKMQDNFSAYPVRDNNAWIDKISAADPTSLMNLDALLGIAGNSAPKPAQQQQQQQQSPAAPTQTTDPNSVPFGTW